MRPNFKKNAKEHSRRTHVEEILYREGLSPFELIITLMGRTKQQKREALQAIFPSFDDNRLDNIFILFKNKVVEGKIRTQIEYYQAKIVEMQGFLELEGKS